MSEVERPSTPAPQSAPITAARKKALPKAFTSLQHYNYRLYFGGQLVSLAGTWMQNIAQGWLVYQISRSEFSLGLVGFAGAIPVLLVSPWGGVLADVLPKRTMLVITQTASMLLAFILSILVFTNVVEVWHVIVMAALLGLVNAFDAPARQSFVVELVGREDLTNAIAMNSMMFNGARVIGPAIGGVILAAVGAGWCFLLNGVSFLAVIAGLLLMRISRPATRPRVEQPVRQLVEGIRYVRSRRDILGLIGLAGVFGFFGMAYSSQLPAFVDRVYHVDATGFGILSAAVGLGAVSGAFILAQFHDVLPRGKLLFIANLSFAGLLFAFSFIPVFELALVAAFGLGTCFMLQMNNINSLLQLQVSNEMRGRVMSLHTLTFFGFSPFGTLLVGSAAESWSLTGAVAVTAVITGALSLLIFTIVPELKKL
jgi:MFS family permease